MDHIRLTPTDRRNIPQRLLSKQTTPEDPLYHRSRSTYSDPHQRERRHSPVRLSWQQAPRPAIASPPVPGDTLPPQNTDICLSCQQLIPWASVLQRQKNYIIVLPLPNCSGDKFVPILIRYSQDPPENELQHILTIVLLPFHLRFPTEYFNKILSFFINIHSQSVLYRIKKLFASLVILVFLIYL